MSAHLEPPTAQRAVIGHGDRGPSGWLHRLVRIDHGPHAGTIGWCRSDEDGILVIDPNDGPTLVRVRREDCSPVI